jgi:hypothetical protein
MTNREVAQLRPVLSPGAVEQGITVIRGHRVLLDSTLAALYEVETRALVQSVRRNAGRFPDDFMFRLTAEETLRLRSQSVISNAQRGGRRYLPYAFTEQGVAMLSSVLRSERAVAVNIEIMRAFVRLRGMLAEHADLVARLDALEEHYDDQFKVVFDAIRELTVPPDEPPKRIGFRAQQ